VLIVPNNWAELQHYKERCPPWVKLHKKLLDNFEFQSLPVASRALAPMLWLLASEHHNGVLDASPQKLSFRLRLSVSDASDALKPLIENKFFSVVADDSPLLAPRKHDATPETEAEQRERRDRLARDFKTFYAAYPKKKAPADAEKAFAKVDVAIDVLLAAIASQRASDDWIKDGGRYIPYPATWLNQRQWENAVEVALATVPPPANAGAALQKIKSDAAKAAPPSLETLARMAELRKPVQREGAPQ
jgi:hypothetical protein